MIIINIMIVPSTGTWLVIIKVQIIFIKRNIFYNFNYSVFQHKCNMMSRQGLCIIYEN